MRKTVPVVIYSLDGERRIVGQADVTVFDGEIMMKATIDSEIAEQFGTDVKQMSIYKRPPASQSVDLDNNIEPHHNID